MTTFNVNQASSNLVFNQFNNSAKRISEFNDAVITSQNSIQPGQFFSIQVEEVDQIWDGNLRIGFTILPDGILFPLARYSIPDMSERGGTWICAIDNEVEMEKNSQRESQSSFKFDKYQHLDGGNLEYQTDGQCKCCMSTSFGSVPIYQLMSECVAINGEKCKTHKPCAIGSIITIYYDVSVVSGENSLTDNICVIQAPDSIGSDCLALIPGQKTSFDSISFKYTFHVLINGLEVNRHEDLVYVIPPNSVSSFANVNPYNFLPQVRAILDVYGSTKSVKIMNFPQNQVKSLQDLCIHGIISISGWDYLNMLPNFWRNYLQIQLSKLSHIS